MGKEVPVGKAIGGAVQTIAEVGALAASGATKGAQVVGKAVAPTINALQGQAMKAALKMGLKPAAGLILKKVIVPEVLMSLPANIIRNFNEVSDRKDLTNGQKIEEFAKGLG